MYNFDIPDLHYRFLSNILENDVPTLEQISQDTPAKHQSSRQVPQKKDWILHFAAGGISGPFSRTVTAPLDRMRLQIQVHPKRQTIPVAFQYLLNHGGVLGLWRGNGINVVKVCPEMAIRFSLFDRIKQFFADTEHGVPLQTYKRFISAALAGMTGQFIIYPMELIKTRMMVKKVGEFKNVIDCAQKIAKFEGFKGFYRGYVSSMIGILPYTGVDLTIYDLLKNRFIFSRLKEGESPATWKYLGCACVSISCGQYCSYPFYLIKARKQARSSHASTCVQGRCEICQMIRTIIRIDGFTGLYRGITLTLLKVLPSGIINYIMFEHAKRILKPYFSRDDM